MESYSRRTSITPSSSKVRWCGVVAELHWLGNLAFLRRPPASTDSKTSLLSMVDSGIFSYQQWIKRNAFSKTNCSQTSTWWVGRNKKFFFQLFHEVSKIRAILHFDNNNRVARRRVIGRDENNEMELNGKHYTCELADWVKWQENARDFRPWMAFPAKKISRKLARIMPLSITVQQQRLQDREFYQKGNFPFSGWRAGP